MSTTFKIIKFKAFDTAKAKGTHYTCAFKGRVFGINTLNFEEGDLTVNKDNTVLTVNCDVQVKITSNTSSDELGQQTTTQFLNIMPKTGLELAQF